MSDHWIFLVIAGLFIFSAGFLFGALWASRQRNHEGER